MSVSNFSWIKERPGQYLCQLGANLQGDRIKTKTTATKVEISKKL
jgi:hypothetical protein